jgi:hypothetical protein
MLVIRVINLVLLSLLIAGVIVMFVTLLRNQQSPKNKAKSKQSTLLSDAGVRDLILEGNKKDALDLYRRFTGVDEFTARQAIDEIERELRLSDNQFDHIHQILLSDGKAAAIEAYQTAAGVNLAEALKFVEAIEKKES